jgi:hypothetical protein
MNFSFEDTLERRETGRCYPVKTKVTRIEKPGHVPDIVIEPSFGVSRQYRHIVTVSHDFRANDAQLERATENSKRMLASYLYSDVIGALDIIAQAAYADDSEAVLITANELRDKLRRSLDEN